jgi:DNA-binding NarL/FixJ family response regulator
MGLPTKPKRGGPSGPTNRSERASSIALIDKRPLMRYCFGRWLAESARDAHIVAVASPAEILENAQLGREAHLIVYSIGAARVADPDVLDSIHALTRSFPEVPIVLLSDRHDVEEVAKAIRHGVRGYIPTKLDLSELAAAIHCVEAGGTFVTAHALIRFVLHQLPTPSSGLEVERKLWERLTPREMEVVARLRQGKRNKVIANELEISESTVKTYVRRILIKLNALNRTEVAHLTEGQFERMQAALYERRSRPLQIIQSKTDPLLADARHVDTCASGTRTSRPDKSDCPRSGLEFGTRHQ